MTRTALAFAIVASSLLGSGVATAQEYQERFSVGMGGFLPDGPAPIGTQVTFNFGRRVNDALRVGAEVSWYRRNYDSRYLQVADVAAASGSVIESVATTHLFPILGTADYYVPAGTDREVYVGLGAGMDYMRTKHFPLGIAAGSPPPATGTILREFTRNAWGLGYVLRAGVSMRPGRTIGAVFLEGYYKGSTIGAEDSLRVGVAADTESRADGIGFKLGFRF